MLGSRVMARRLLRDKVKIAIDPENVASGPPFETRSVTAFSLGFVTGIIASMVASRL